MGKKKKTSADFQHPNLLQNPGNSDNQFILYHFKIANYIYIKSFLLFSQ